MFKNFKRNNGISVFLRLLDGASKRCIPPSPLILFPSPVKNFTSNFDLWNALLRNQLHKTKLTLRSHFSVIWRTFLFFPRVSNSRYYAFGLVSLHTEQKSHWIKRRMFTESVKSKVALCSLCLIVELSEFQKVQISRFSLQISSIRWKTTTSRSQIGYNMPSTLLLPPKVAKIKIPFNFLISYFNIHKKE